MDSLLKTKLGIWFIYILAKSHCKISGSYMVKKEGGGKRRYKARLAVKGFAQNKGISCDEIFSHVVKMF